jgi:hypothetical protein
MRSGIREESRHLQAKFAALFRLRQLQRDKSGTPLRGKIKFFVPSLLCV